MNLGLETGGLRLDIRLVGLARSAVSYIRRWAAQYWNY